MANSWDNDDERTTSRGNRKITDSDHTLGQLMVESLNHRRRIEVLETRLDVQDARIRVLATKTQDSLSPSSGSTPPGRRSQLFILARKTFVTTAVIIAAIISALKELGYLK